jgi:D-glycero-D-manno-heptose 1,7-bisphosphate phosphatase
MSQTSIHKSVLDTGRFFHPTQGSRLTVDSTGTKQVVFLDRDGVLVADDGHLTDPAKMKILPGAPEALLRLWDDFYLIVITNQSCVSRGLLTENGLMGIHVELCDRLAALGVILDGIYYCPHHPTEGDGPYCIHCRCRKPGPGMLLQAKADWNIDMGRSFMVGDNFTDATAAQAAGVKAILVGEIHEGEPVTAPEVQDLAAAADRIISQSKPAGSGISGGLK